jgi:hypothetical protein
MEEYDKAKFIFALSGYDHFDACNVHELNIDGDNMTIDIKILDQESVFSLEESDRLPILLMLSIWLGNAHCFIGNIEKAITSYFIGRYLGSYFFHLSHKS